MKLNKNINLYICIIYKLYNCTGKVGAIKIHTTEIETKEGMMN